jgi:putative flippase GtrA
MKPKLLLMLPIYNEEEQLESSMRTVFDYASKNLTEYEWRVHVGDNASKDRSKEIYTKLHNENPTRFTFRTLDKKGRGLNLRESWLKEDYDIAIYMDVDLSSDINAIKDMVDHIRDRKADLSIGSRLLPTSKVIGRKLLREITSRGYVFIIKTLASTKISDFQCGFKAISKELALKIVPEVEDNTWYFDTELILLTEKSGYKVYECPVRWTDDPGSTVNVWKTAIEDLKGLYRTLKQKKWLRITSNEEVKKKYSSTLFEFLMQFSKFFFIGGVSLLINWGVMLLTQRVIHAEVVFSIGDTQIKDYMIGAVLGFIVSAIVNYFLNKKFTFNNKLKAYGKQMTKFFMVSIIGLILNTAITILLVEQVRVSPTIVTPLAAAIVLFWNYFGHRVFTFKV